MTEIERAINEFQSLIEYISNAYHDDKNKPKDGDWNTQDACVLAIVALREKAERENPKPMTLDELRERDGRPVWCVGVPDETGWDGWGNPLWMLVNTREESVQTGDESADFDNYGEWLAYDYPPKEARDDAD